MRIFGIDFFEYKKTKENKNYFKDEFSLNFIDRQYSNIIDEINIVVNRIATDFSKGVFEITDLEGNTVKYNEYEKSILDKLNSGDKFSNKEDFLYKEISNRKYWGVSWIWMSKGFEEYNNSILSFIGLESDNVIATKNGKDIFSLEVENLNDIIQSVSYRGRVLENDTYIVTTDLAPDINNLRFISRPELILNKIKLGYHTTNSLTEAMQRSAQVILTPDEKEKQTGGGAGGFGNSHNNDEAQEEQKRFRDAFSIDKGAISWLPKQVKSVNINANNRKMMALETMTEVFKSVCHMYDVPYEIFDSKTTFNNQEYIIKRYHNTIENEGKVLGGSIADFLNLKEQNRTIKLNYDHVLEVLMSGVKKEDSIEDDSEAQRIKLQSQANLRGTVGGVDGILSIQESVKNNTTSYDSALTILEEIFGFESNVARNILGNEGSETNTEDGATPENNEQQEAQGVN